MDIYNDDGSLDIEKAAGATRSLTSARSAEDAKRRGQELQIATLLDIAVSLRTIAAEAALAMGEVFTVDNPSATEEPEVGPPVFAVGDRVRVDGSDVVCKIISLGEDQDEPYAVVAYADAPEGDTFRIFTKNLNLVSWSEPAEPLPHVSTDEEDAEMIDADDAPELFEDQPAVLEDVTDDIDADFDGDHHPAAADAVEKLKANEAARKAAKKGKKK